MFTKLIYTIFDLYYHCKSLLKYQYLFQQMSGRWEVHKNTYLPSTLNEYHISKILSGDLFVFLENMRKNFVTKAFSQKSRLLIPITVKFKAFNVYHSPYINPKLWNFLEYSAGEIKSSAGICATGLIINRIPHSQENLGSILTKNLIIPF